MSSDTRSSDTRSSETRSSETRRLDRLVHQPVQTAPWARRASRVPEPQRRHLRRQLEEQRRFRIEQIDQLAAQAAEATLAEDEARRQVNRALTVAAEWALGDINAALSRLDHRTYGTCERCTQPIPLERLEILPMTRLCFPCDCRERV